MNLRDLFGVGTKLKESILYSRTTTKSIPVLQPEHGFSQQNRPERGQVQEWYPNEKMVVVLVCLNGRYYSSRQIIEPCRDSEYSIRYQMFVMMTQNN